MAKSRRAVAEDQAVSLPTALTPAAVVGTNTKIELSKELLASLPEQFRGVSFDVIETGFAPTIKWNKPGNFCIGVYEGMEEKVGPHESRLYNFDAQGNKFGVWGTTVLDRAFDNALKAGIVKPGYVVMLTYVGDVESDYNPCKIFHMQVANKA